MKNNNVNKVLLLGNGINRAFSENTISWDKLVKESSCFLDDKEKERISKMLEADKKGNITLPLEIVLRTQDHCNEFIKDICSREKLYGKVDNEEYVEILQKILSAGFDYILTTNYSYELESAAFSTESIKVDKLKKIYKNINGGRADNKYSLSSYNNVTFNGAENKIWHIHGEARKYSSIIIEHYAYGKLLHKYIEHLDETANYYFNCQKNNRPITIKKWIDAFIMGDVYILGLGLSFSEMDLWWLINRKKKKRLYMAKYIFTSLLMRTML